MSSKRHYFALTSLAIALALPTVALSQSPSVPNDSAATQPPSLASIDELLEVMHARENLALAINQIGPAMTANLAKGVPGVKDTPNQIAFRTELADRFLKAMEAKLPWESMHAYSVSVYQSVYTEQEVRSLIEMYKTPTGQMALSKVPLVQKQVQQFMMETMGSIAPELQQIFAETEAKYALPHATNPASSSSAR